MENNANKGRQFLARLKQNAIILALVALFVVFSILSPSFTKAENLINIARQISFLGVASVGMMFVILLGGVDLSIGSVIMVVNVICAKLMVDHKMPPGLAVLAVFVIALLVGTFNGMLVARIKMPPFIVTMAMMNILQGVALLISGGLPVFGLPESFAMLGQGYIGVIPIPVIIMILVFIMGWFLLNKTYIGRALYAIGGNEEASRLSGINTERIKCAAYAASSVCACLAGIIMLSRLNSGTPNTGKEYEFKAITAVVLGGVSASGGAGRISGVLIGVFIIGILNNGLILANVNSYWQYVLNGAVLIIAVGVDYYTRNRSTQVAAMKAAKLEKQKTVA